MTTTLRHATRDDLQQIASLLAESRRTTYRGIYSDEYLDKEVIADLRRVWNGRLRTPGEGQVVILALGGFGLEGFVSAYGNDDPTWGSRIDNLHVTPERKRSGTGTLLMRECSDWLHQHYPRPGVYLWVLDANAPARRFYERLGAHNAEAVEQSTPGGGSALSCRYVWRTPEVLHRACLAQQET